MASDLVVEGRVSGPEFRLSGVGSDLSVVLDDSGEPDDVNFRVFGFEVLPKVFR